MTPSSSIVFAGEVYGEGAVGGGVHLQRRGPVVIALRNKLLGVVMTWASGSIDTCTGGSRSSGAEMVVRAVGNGSWSWHRHDDPKWRHSVTESC